MLISLKLSGKVDSSTEINMLNAGQYLPPVSGYSFDVNEHCILLSALLQKRFSSSNIKKACLIISCFAASVTSAGCVQTSQIMALRHVRRLSRQPWKEKLEATIPLWRLHLSQINSCTGASMRSWSQPCCSCQLAACGRVPKHACYPGSPEGRIGAGFPCRLERIIQKHETQLPPNFGLQRGTSVRGCGPELQAL